MEYVQERITTLHALREPTIETTTDAVGVIVPITERDCGSLAAERVFTELARVGPGHVFVPVNAPPERIERLHRWIDGFDLTSTVLWCNADSVEERLQQAGVGTRGGKGRDVWLALGLATARSELEYLVVHDADARSYSTAVVNRLVWPLQNGFEAAKGYYARVENDRLYGRLFRLLYVPLIRALGTQTRDEIVSFLSSFRYALAGEIGLTVDLARRCRPYPGWGLEVGMLGDLYEHAGFTGTCQVDLGVHEHEHRAVSGPTGLSMMSDAVAGALLRTIEAHGISIDYEATRREYRRIAEQLVAQYGADARFNGLTFDRSGELEQVDTYIDAIGPPGPDPRLPAWTTSPIDVETVLGASTEAISAIVR